jgi:hypothetical protein
VTALVQICYVQIEQVVWTVMSETDPGQSMVYQIRIKGHLDHHWTDWFSGLAVTLEDNGDTLLTGPVEDQAALHGLLKKVRDLGMPLISVIGRKPDPTDRPELKQTGDFS